MDEKMQIPLLKKQILLMWVFLLPLILLAQRPATVKVIGTGDIMLGNTYPPEHQLLPADGGRHLFDEVKPYLRAADVAFGNLEGVLMDSVGEPRPRGNTSVPYFIFKMPEKSVNLLLDAGYDIVSVANNHVNDFQSLGRNRTQQVLRSAGLKFAGSSTQKSIVFEKNGVKYGFCAFSTAYDSPSIYNASRAKDLISELSEKCDIVIVSFHGGQEGSQYTHLPFASEYGMGNSCGDLYVFAHACVDAGADIVFGHGPHVARAVELYKGRFIAYSLGNFCTPYGMNITGVSGYAPMIQVEVKLDGQFVEGQIFAAKQVWGRGPKMDAAKSVVKEIKTLTEEDFPESLLQISDSGKITRK